MTDPKTPAPSKRPSRLFLKALIALAVLVVLFYGEEDWRGRHAWNDCKQALQARGAKLDWADYVPPPVPDNENIFAIPEMQKWFVGKGTNDFTQLLLYPAWENPTRTVVAQLNIGLADSTAPPGFTALQWEDPQIKEQAGRLIRQALGPVIMDPAGSFYTLQSPETNRPAQIFLQCQGRPEEKDLQILIPFPLASSEESSNADARIESAGDGSYKLTMRTPSSVAEFLKWNEKLEPEFTLISNALQRPSARMTGDYQVPADIPVPDFVAIRNLSQRLGALARCYMALGQPEKALNELTFMHHLSRMLEARPTGKPMTLVAAMINVSLAGMYVGIAEDGLRFRFWTDAQLAALQDQLKEINLAPYLRNAILEEPAGVCYTAEKLPQNLFQARWSKRRSFVLYHFIPSGWIYQNMVVYANLQQDLADGFGAEGQAFVPHKIESAAQNVQTRIEADRGSPFGYLAGLAIPNFTKAAKSLVVDQTRVNQAQIVCALDRFRLMQGEYPATLEPLTLLFLPTIPNDVVGGQPPHYRRNRDGSFTLYSIGWDELDHQGLNGVDIVWNGR